MTAIKIINLLLRFLLELGALAAVGYWGFHTGRSVLTKIILGLGAPLLVAVFWGVFVAPGADVPVSGALHLVMELGVFALATASLFAVDRPRLAWMLGLVFVINRLLMAFWRQ